MTQGEWNLWGRLRNRQLDGFKFRRQHPIGPLIVDFACPATRLVVELDGPDHDPQQDARRDRLLSERGWRVLRVNADHVFEGIDWMVELIREQLLAGPPRPSR
jgi:very-short-patch-repair endonuclease